MIADGSRAAEVPGLQKIHTDYDLRDPSEQEAVRRAYDVVRRHHGPFVASIAKEMLTDLRAEASVDPRLSVVFLGRDGYSLSVAVRALDSQFHGTFCHDVVLSRAVVEAAVQDRERNGGEDFSRIQSFRESRSVVNEDDISGASQRLTDYLQDQGIPAGERGRVVLVDSCLKGTIQELLAALYRDTTFEGKYMFFDGIASDPHPDSKRGYVVHRNAGIGGGLTELPDDVALTFASIPAIRTIENLLQGPLSSPRRIDGSGPVQKRLQEVDDPTWGCNPVVVSDDYRNPRVREAVKVTVLEAVRDAASAMAHGAPSDTARIWPAFTGQMRAWLRRDPSIDPELRTVLDSFVHRDDHPQVRQLDVLLREAGLDEPAARRLWERFDQAGTLPQKKTLVKQVEACGGDVDRIRAVERDTPASGTGLPAQEAPEAGQIGKAFPRPATSGPAPRMGAGQPPAPQPPPRGPGRTRAR